MSTMTSDMGHHWEVKMKDGRSFSHACDNTDCHLRCELELSGFSTPLRYEDVDYAVSWRPRE